MKIFIIFYILISFNIIYLLCKKIKKDKFSGAYIGIVFGMLLYYVLVPTIFIIFEKYYNSTYRDYHYSKIQTFVYSKGYTMESFLFSIILLIIALISLNIGYNFSFKSKRKSLNDKIKFLLSKDNNEVIKYLNSVGKYCLIIGLIGLLVYIKAFGGLDNLLKISDSLRQHNTTASDYGVSGIAKYMLMIASVSTISPIAFYISGKKNSKKSMKNKLLFYISIAVSSVYFLLNSGKSAILRMIIMFLYFQVIRKTPRAWRFILCIGIIAMPVLDILDLLFIQQSEMIGKIYKNINYYKYIIPFSYPIQIILNVKDITNVYGFLYFKNVITDILSLLPGVNFKASYENTSEFMRGSHWKELGGTPNDIISYGYIQLGIIGVIITFLAVGFIIGLLDRYISRIKDKLILQCISCFICINMFSIVSAADLGPILKYNIPFVLFIYCIYKIYIKEKNKEIKILNSKQNYI